MVDSMQRNGSAGDADCVSGMVGRDSWTCMDAWSTIDRYKQCSGALPGGHS